MSGPVFDASALSALTQKIQGDFNSGADPRKTAGKGKGKDKSKDTAAKVEAQSQHHKDSTRGPKRKRDTKERPSGSGSAQESPKKKQAKQTPKVVDSNGNSKPTPKARISTAREAPKASRSREKSSGASNGAASKARPEVDLRALVSELGGDDEDMKLIDDAGSESEVEGQDGQTSAALKKDIQSMIKELGIPQAQIDDTSSEEDEHENEAETEASISESDGSGEEAEERVDDDGESDSEAESQEPGLITQAKQALDQLPSRKRSNPHGLVIEPLSQWHTAELPGITAEGRGNSTISSDVLQRIHDHAKTLLNRENERYAAINKNSNSANKFYATIMTSGTLSDKISAFTLSVQESPLHNVQNLESLLTLAKKRNRGQAIEVLGALKDLLGPGGLLPPDRRLRTFGSQPALKFLNGKDAKLWTVDKPLPQPLTEAHLIVWAFEDWLKASYFEILKILEVWMNDEIVFSRGKAVDFVYELLRDKPEQEANLLRLLVNKLGDKDKQTASKSSYHILQVENAHPAMKPLIITAVETDLIFRPRQSNHAKYYGIITLNQTVLSSKEEDVARQLLSIYFAIFLDLLKKPKPQQDEPEAKVTPKFNAKGDAQGGGSAPGKKAQKKAAAQARAVVAEDELRERMLSAVLTGVNRALPYVDKTSDYFDKHLDTLFRVTHSANFNTSIQALILIQQLSGTHQAASNRFYRTLYESLLDPRLLTSSKQALYLNLLYRALRSDLSVKRVKAFTKRLLQVVSMQQPSFACAVIYLIRELEEAFPSLSAFIDQPEADESDEEEVFRDVPEETSDVEQGTEPIIAPVATNPKDRSRPRYDGRKRDPEHAYAELSCLWELAPLQCHYHPSVSLFATSLSKHEKMPSKPDLGVNTLIHFLDRFVYRNPKKASTGLRGHSIMQPLASSGDTSGMLVSAKNRNSNARAPVNTDSFRNKKSDDVGVEDVFFHKYFAEIGKKTDKAKKKRADKKSKREDDDNSDDSEMEGNEDEDEIWQALVNSRPEIEGDDEIDAGWDDVDDFEEEMDEDKDSDDEMGGVEIHDLPDDEGENEEDEDEGEDEESFGFDDDDDDVLGSDAELPEGFDADDAKQSEDASNSDDDDDGVTGTKKAKNKEKSKRRKMLKSLPMFASVDDYAAMLEGDDED